VAAAIDETSLRDTLWTLAVILAMGIPFAAGLAIAGGYFLAGRVLSPVGAMAQKAREITAESLAKRLPVDNARDEFGQLATVFKVASARLVLSDCNREVVRLSRSLAVSRRSCPGRN
jgi:HAMP domain-containing protein